MPGERRTHLLLAALVGILVYVVWRALAAPDAAVPARPTATARRSGTAAGAAPLTPPADVRLEDLSRPALSPTDPTRNPFVFGERPAPPSAAMRRAPSSAPEPVTFAPAGPPPIPPIPLKFIGLVEGASGTRIAVLSDTRGLVVHGSEGTIIDGRFRILAIGAETLDIAYADGRGRQTLRLTGQ